MYVFVACNVKIVKNIYKRKQSECSVLAGDGGATLDDC